ncbi:hypothetical protein C8R44DRAFT_787457 [Mycena epipterygia]|nr:hypothetical protein C8R44DRAFT_787457 [Mycena epipterygia]
MPARAIHSLRLFFLPPTIHASSFSSFIKPRLRPTPPSSFCVPIFASTCPSAPSQPRSIHNFASVFLPLAHPHCLPPRADSLSCSTASIYAYADTFCRGKLTTNIATDVASKGAVSQGVA